MRDVAKQYDVDSHIECNLNWQSSKWQAMTKTWSNQFRNVKTNEVFEQECKILISAIGGLVEPQDFDLEGLENFKGRIIHSARWRKDVNLKDKDVVVVGNGCKIYSISLVSSADLAFRFCFTDSAGHCRRSQSLVSIHESEQFPPRDLSPLTAQDPSILLSKDKPFY
jgi:hypothetical protein